MAKRTRLEGEGLTIGGIYSVVAERTVELIPRDRISYVSAEYKSYRILFVIAAILFGVAIVQYLNRSVLTVSVLLASGLGVIAVLTFFLTRKVGVVIASSGGRLFVETRGRDRYELLDRIYDDLDRNRRLADTSADEHPMSERDSATAANPP